jgi:hypothetical protein
MSDKNNQSYDEKDIVFRYSRERRLDRASETVRKLNEDGKKYSFSLFRPLTATKPLRFLFMSVIILLAMMYLFSFLFGSRDEIVFGGNIINVSAFTFEGKTYFTLEKEIKDKNNFYTGTIDLAISPSNASSDDASSDDVLSDDNAAEDNNSENIEIHTERIFFTAEAEENFKMAIPFEAERLLILIQSDKEIQRLNVITE